MAEVAAKETLKIALGVSGGIAAYKAAEILRGLQRAGCSVRVGMTKRACEFVQPLTFKALSGSHVVVDDYSPDNPDPIAHITFSQTVDLFLVAPATANILAKFANGIADDFLTTTYLACKAPVMVAPAMNTMMWHHLATQRNVERLRADGVHILDPDEGEMACGTVGPGRLSEPQQIVAAVMNLLRSRSGNRDLNGERFLITTGATREAIDPVRFISNRSSGRMGLAIAEAARDRGASVTVVAANSTIPFPPGIKVTTVTSADEMYEAVMQELGQITVFVGAAAVADYKPTQTAFQKIKKSDSTISLKLDRTRDILQEVAAKRAGTQLVIGFAAETENVIENALDKLQRKKLDAVVANDVSRTDAGFDSNDNAVTIITCEQSPLELPLMSKRDAAQRILDEIVRLRRTRKLQVPSTEVDTARA
jgi:phosphopantothenoylcysteine decarboxylase/phosphopantothenate--cysteine ligase